MEQNLTWSSTSWVLQVNWERTARSKNERIPPVPTEPLTQNQTGFFCAGRMTFTNKEYTIARDLPNLHFCRFRKIQAMPMKSVGKKKKKTYQKENAGTTEGASSSQRAAAARWGRGSCLPKAAGKMAAAPTPPSVGSEERGCMMDSPCSQSGARLHDRQAPQTNRQWGAGPLGPHGQSEALGGEGALRITCKMTARACILPLKLGGGGLGVGGGGQPLRIR